jgi:hypothetical protein
VESTCTTASFHWETVWTHTTSLTQPFIIEVPVPSQESQRSCICVSILPFYSIFQLNFGTVPTVWYFFPIELLFILGTIAIVGLMIGSVLDTSIGKDNSHVFPDANNTNDSSIDLGTTGMTELDIEKIKLATALSFVSGLIMVNLIKLCHDEELGSPSDVNSITDTNLKQ